MSYPNSLRETLADGCVHLIGLCLAIPASFLLLTRPQMTQEVWNATALYVGTLVFALGASALYHMAPFDRTRTLLGRIDHAAIYFKIAGSYSPVAVLINTSFAYGVLALVWALAGIGALAKLSFWRLDAKGSLALYLGMGWLSVLLIWPISQTLPVATLALIVAGGLIYSAGTVIYANPDIRYKFAAWHLCVLIASSSLFAAIAVAVQRAEETRVLPNITAQLPAHGESGLHPDVCRHTSGLLRSDGLAGPHAPACG